MNVSRTGFLIQGGLQDPLHLKGWLLASAALFPTLSKNYFRRKCLAKSSMSAYISDQLMRCGIRTKVNPRESSLISASESCALESRVLRCLQAVGWRFCVFLNEICDFFFSFDNEADFRFVVKGEWLSHC